MTLRVKVDKDLPTAIVQLVEDGIRPVVELIRQALDQYKLDALTGTISVATPRGIRIRRPPSQSADADDGAQIEPQPPHE